MTTGLVIQARHSSERLPGKVCLPLGDTTVLGQVIRQALAVVESGHCVVATSTEPADEAVAREAARLGVACWRGSLEDVLGRFWGVVASRDWDQVIRVTGDNPFTSPAHLASLIELHRAAGADHSVYKGLPLGATAEAASRSALEAAFQESSDRPSREHVTWWIYQRPERFLCQALTPEPRCRRPDLRLTVDTPADYDLAREIVRRLGQPAGPIPLDQVLDLLGSDPALAARNADVRQKAAVE